MDPLVWALMLIAVAVVVMVIELFLPSAGVLGFLAGGLVLASLFMAYRSSFLVGSIFLMAVLICLPILIYGLLQMWPHTPIGKRILLSEPDLDQILPPSMFSNDLVGQIGISKTKMLPSGTIVVNRQKLDAVSSGFPIDANQAVKITAVRANRIYVEPYENEATDLEHLPARDDEMLAQPFEDLGLGLDNFETKDRPGG